MQAAFELPGTSHPVQPVPGEGFEPSRSITEPAGLSPGFAVFSVHAVYSRRRDLPVRERACPACLLDPTVSRDSVSKPLASTARMRTKARAGCPIPLLRFEMARPMLDDPLGE